MSPRGRKQRELVTCRWAGCGTQTFEHMLAWHEDKCKYKANGDASIVEYVPFVNETVTTDIGPGMNLGIPLSPVWPPVVVEKSDTELETELRASLAALEERKRIKLEAEKEAAEGSVKLKSQSHCESRVSPMET